MNQSLLSKYILVVALTLWAFWEIYPPKAQDLIALFELRAENTDEAFSAVLSKARQELSEGDSDNVFSVLAALFLASSNDLMVSASNFFAFAFFSLAIDVNASCSGLGC